MLEIKDKKFEVIIERKSIRNIYLRVEDNTVKVTCPKYVSNIEIYKFIDSKRKWIYNCSNKNRFDSKLTISDEIYYKGIKYKFIVLKGMNNIKIDSDTIYIRCKTGDKKEASKVFYEYGKKEILEYVKENEHKYLKILRDYGYQLSPIYNVKYLKSMWGCCYNQKNTINLSVRLIHFDHICLDAILWHELLHFIIPNHSKRYHNVLNRHMPDYEKIVKTLY